MTRSLDIAFTPLDRKRYQEQEELRVRDVVRNWLEQAPDAPFICRVPTYHYDRSYSVRTFRRDEWITHDRKRLWCCVEIGVNEERPFLFGPEQLPECLAGRNGH